MCKCSRLQFYSRLYPSCQTDINYLDSEIFVHKVDEVFMGFENNVVLVNDLFVQLDDKDCLALFKGELTIDLYQLVDKDPFLIPYEE